MTLHRTLLVLLAAISQIGLSTASPFAYPSRGTTQGSSKHQRNFNKYRPIDPSSLSDYEGRDTTATAGVGDFVYSGMGGLMHAVNKEYGLRQSESFYWGPAGNPHANLTAYTAGGQNVRVLSLERFQNVLQNAKCMKTLVEFTFLSEVNFDRVQEEWGWINDAEDHYLVLVTENARCNIPDGDRTVRQPWHVTIAVFDDTANKVTLTAKPKTWEDAFDHWQLKISSKGLAPQSAHTSRSLVKRLGYNGTQSLSLEANFATDPIELTSSNDSDATASIGCDPCYTTGSLDFDIDITYWFPAQISGSVIMTPNNVGATFVANIEASEELTSQHSASKELFALHPDGIDIDNFVTIGPEFTINLAAGIDSLDAKMDVFSSGISMSIPAEAIAVLDFDDSSLNQFQDWSPVFAPAMPENSLSAEVSLSAFAGIRTRIEFDIELFNYGFLAGFALDAPSFGVTLTGQAADGGVCDKPDAEFGVDLSVDLFAELDFFVGVGGDDDEPNKQNIFSTGVPIFTTCMVVASGAPAPSAAPSALPSAALGNVSAPAYPSGSAAPSGSIAALSSQPVPASSLQATSSSSAVISSATQSFTVPAASSSAAVISYAPQSSSAPAGSSTAMVISSSPQSSSAPAAVSSAVIVSVSSVAAAPSAASSGW